ncbi:MAG: electron transfer flavoprotein subunit alpha/FixB family protein [Acidimicrobiaceae bacterium]|jgi:electron transfer flavoprotein alpha subunit|nr:electron transfer flavoprotein subunit alpha/FixB family protein [Acidimicrobiaceae bacterium]MBP6488210.1 electron transfer flavoprotein subunit alpha/FixB family protein [Ilumatobacteraceae bacterium]MBP7888384.1 electron transfer flavoprotein subunit alpha/FixB family protein [Ilumatobacteraceae bacterium]HAN36567.1 electron transfer flavoprotein subunit alpha/FixB family protein [Acidimicrobiaceae bacterium]HQY13543.1 electron transfer flavoprotein subunit alpha/FixB family protein [Ilum
MNIWVFSQEASGAPTTATLELLTKARTLAASVGGNVTAFVGGDASAIAGSLGEHGAAKVYATGDLGGKLPGAAVSAAMKAVIDGGDTPDLIMFPQTTEGRDIMSRLSVKLDRTVLTNNVDITVDGGAVSVTTPIFGGNVLVSTAFSGAGPFLAAFRPKSFVAESAGGAAAAITAAPVPELGATGAAQVTAVHVEATSGPKLDEAAIVVSGGRGLGEAAKYEMVEALAKLLNGAPGASRAIVDAGWVPYSYQVGQTGKVVKPGVYIACGISGATQHMVGMKGSKNIIAINKDKEAPIFGIADLGIVGDVHKVLPKLIEALQSRG